MTFMSRFIPLLATMIAAYAFTVAPAHAAAILNSEGCGGRFVNKPSVPAQPGCRLKGCRIFYEIAHDKKGTYCIRSRGGCLVRCDKPKM